MTVETLTADLHDVVFEPDRWPGVLSCLTGRIAARWTALVIAFDSEPLVLASEAAVDQSGYLAFRSAVACRHDVRLNWFATEFQARRSGSEAEPLPVRLVVIGGAETNPPPYVALVPVVRGVTLAAGFSLEGDPESFLHATQERLDSVFPRLAHAVASAIRVGAENARTAVDAMALMGRAAVAVDRRGRSVARNPIFGQAPLKGRLGSDGRVSFGKPQADEQVLAALDRISTAIQHGAEPATLQPVMVTQQGENPACFVTLYPFARSVRDPFSAAVALIVEDPLGSRTAADPIALSACFGLTSAEARTASVAGTGMAIDDIAALTRTGRETVRTHLKRVLAKTGTVRQAELVALLAPFAGCTVRVPRLRKPEAAGMDADCLPSNRRRPVGIGCRANQVPGTRQEAERGRSLKRDEVAAAEPAEDLPGSDQIRD